MGTFVSVCVVFDSQLNSDGTVTIEEQIVLVLRAKVQCELNITAQLQEGGKDAEKPVYPPPSSPQSLQLSPVCGIRELSRVSAPPWGGGGTRLLSSLTRRPLPVERTCLAEFGGSGPACAQEQSSGLSWDLPARGEHAHGCTPAVLRALSLWALPALSGRA